ncbi:MAG: hypothetical protein ACO1NM_13625 [Sphingobium phenoxybenzoativorans]
MKHYALAALLLVCACSSGDEAQNMADNAQDNAADGNAAAVPEDFSIHCKGAITEVMSSSGGSATKEEGPGTDVTYRWDRPEKMLYLEKVGTAEAPYCEAGAKGCSVEIDEKHILAQKQSETSGDADGTLVARTERVEIDLTTLTGNSVIRTSSGALQADKTPAIAKKTVNAPLNCERLF